MKQTRYLFVIVVALIGIYSKPWYWLVSPDTSYRLITGNKLPEGVKAVNFGSQINDDLFHTAYYWKFEHPPPGLESLLIQLHAGDESENYADVVDYRGFDTIWVLSSFEDVFGTKIPTSTIGKGYELTGNNGRDDWLLVDKNGFISYLEWN